MIKRFAICTFIAGSACILMSLNTVTGWFPAGNEPGAYEMGIASKAGRHGDDAATIKSIRSNIEGFGTLMQIIKPTQFLGKRVRMSGYIKTDKVSEWTGFWMRVDRVNKQNADSVWISSPSFDNMENRPITGTTGWTKYEIVLDVPVNASSISYGAQLGGPGQIWFDDISFEAVGNPVTVTQLPDYDASTSYAMTSKKYANKKMLQIPSNLRFDNK